MERFLSSVAKSLWEHYGEDISTLRIVVPNMRSRLFFADALSPLISERPIWQPSFTTIDELIVEASGLNHIDPIRAIIELYKVYSEHHREELDKFYFWGEILLSDFDGVDKYRIDADMLFSNMRDLRTMEDDYAYMTSEQKAIVRRFWENFGQEQELGQIKNDFLSIWNSLGAIYTTFRERLRASGVGYGGMLYRDVADKIKRGDELTIPRGQYIIVGFNALSECEKIIFDRLHTDWGAEFFWDTDDYYINNPEQEAGLFLRDNIVRYPNAAYFNNRTDNFTRSKQFSVTAAPSASMQCRNVASFLRSLPAPLDKETAIVLADENLLMPVLYSLPKELEAVNVTMGYPVRITTAYIAVEKWLAELKAGKMADVPDLADALVEFMSRSTTEIPNIATDYERRLQRECFGTMAEAVHKLKNSIEACKVELSPKLFAVLARRVLQRLRIPYSGEPLAGVQIMGILETRNLDFKNVIVLSMNDDTLPATHSASSSFIPYNLRYGYGLPTPSHHDAVYAYYFYRLVQRAEHIELVYPARNDSDSTGEPSRYIYQLEYESDHHITRRDIGLRVNLPQIEPIIVTKTEEVMKRLQEYLAGGTRTLSPTAFNKYLACPLQFYFNSVEHIRVPDEQTTEMDASTFGNILHKAMELLYSPFKGIHNPSPQIKALIGSDKVFEAIDSAIEEVTESSRYSYDGETMLTRETIAKYINSSVLPFDAHLSNWTILDTEHRLNGTFKFGGRLEIRFSGISDRVDKLDNGTIRIVDYKTGKMQKDFAGIETMFSNDKQAKSGAMVQTFIYSMMMYDEGADVIPALYYVRAMNSADYSMYIAPKDTTPEPYSKYKMEFEAALGDTLTEIYNPDVPFIQCEDTKACKLCDFARICNRI